MKRLPSQCRYLERPGTEALWKLLFVDDMSLTQEINAGRDARRGHD